jgi:acetyltransferase-like isoleucine patch superfamily enzyme
MPLEIEDHGVGNLVEMGRAERAALAGQVVFLGDGARVTFGPGCVSEHGMRLEVGSGVVVEIGRDNHLGALFVHAVAGAVVTLGDGLGLNGQVRLLLHEPARIAIGSGCLIAADVDITVSDMHPIFDLSTGGRINPAADVAIADRVWIGQRSMVMKGAVIGHETVIGAGSVVTGTLPAHCIAAGSPARVVRTGTRWDWSL